METKTREELVLTSDEARRILDRRNKDFEIISDQIIDNSRWSINFKLVIKRLSDNKYFSNIYSVGATECQDERPWENMDANFQEVFPVEKIMVIYE